MGGITVSAPVLMTMYLPPICCVPWVVFTATVSGEAKLPSPV